MTAPTFSGAPLIAPGNVAPVAICGLDPTSGLIYSQGCANYTVVSTIGTSTIKAGPGGLYYGMNAISTGTAVMTAVVYDVVVSGTTTVQLNPAAAPGALGAFGQPGPNSTGGVRFVGTLIVITSGTAGTYNVLWD